MLYHPQINPVAIKLLNLEVRWYALMYVAGIIFVYWFLRRAVQARRLALTQEQLDTVLGVGFLGMLLGAKALYIGLYNPEYYLENPEKILSIASSGSAFHGALVGIGFALFVYARLHGLSFLAISDHVVTAAPFGIGLGRIGNFINQELWGKETNAPWGMVFPVAGPSPRHPSQLYESFLEGWLLLALMLCLYRYQNQPSVPNWLRRPGILTATFLCCYALARFTAEIWRMPDVQLGLLDMGVLGNGWSMGQILSLGMFAIGLLLGLRTHTCNRH